MSTKIIRTVIIMAALVVFVGLGYWGWKQWVDGFAKAPVATAPETQSPAPLPHTPLEEYGTALSSVKARYETSVAQLGSTPVVRMAKKAEWKKVVDGVIAQLLTLTAPAEDRKKHQDRIILLTQLSQELGKESPEASLLESAEKELPVLW